MAFLIRPYAPEDEIDLFALIKREGDEWAEYWSTERKPGYQKALAGSLVYLAFADEALCGYVRCRDDDGFGIYICDLLVDKDYRGNGFGRLLMERVCRDHPDEPVYVLGDVYPYYEEKLGYAIEGKIYIVKAKEHERRD